MRQTWTRLVRKQWLIFYPLALAVINTLAFLAIYTATGRPLAWSPFFSTNFDRWQFVYDNFIGRFAFRPALAVAVVAGIAVCALAAMIRAPYFRAIAGPGYPLAPRHGREAVRLSLFYVFSNLVTWAFPFAGATHGYVAELIAFLVLVISILIVFADYVIVFEDVGFFAALRRSLHLVARRWLAVIVIFIILQLVYLGLSQLYHFYYDSAQGTLIVLPLLQIVLDSLIVLLTDLVLIFLYERARSRAR